MAPPNDFSHYRRQSFRLQGYDYRNEGMYFVTICTKDRLPYFGQIIDNQMVLSEIGQIVWDNWFKIPQFSPHIALDEFVVMPNHIHGILAIVQSVASLQCNDATRQPHNATTTIDTDKNQLMSAISPKSGSISRVLNSYKGACSKEIKKVASLQCNDATRQYNDATGFDWQSKFHDRIIRNEEELCRIQQYIIHNPNNWKDDENHF
ncbi:transposase [Runella aurantiaca]|uniref:Transposase n=1 Tax=Runella aurantiaca TaxID=2282308 RepID=A0A369HY44_9BACT|nr:transposase [Runella aurantiaca]RDB02451.1 transposase [Runella aurantiaca]